MPLEQIPFKQKFKYEDVRVAMLLFQKGDYLFPFDLKFGYHHVDIAEMHHKAMVIKFTVSQTRPRPFFSLWPPFLLRYCWPYLFVNVSPFLHFPD